MSQDEVMGEAIRQVTALKEVHEKGDVVIHPSSEYAHAFVEYDGENAVVLSGDPKDNSGNITFPRDEVIKARTLVHHASCINVGASPDSTLIVQI